MLAQPPRDDILTPWNRPTQPITTRCRAWTGPTVESAEMESTLSGVRRKPSLRRNNESKQACLSHPTSWSKENDTHELASSDVAGIAGSRRWFSPNVPGETALESPHRVVRGVNHVAVAPHHCSLCAFFASGEDQYEPCGNTKVSLLACLIAIE